MAEILDRNRFHTDSFVALINKGLKASPEEVVAIGQQMLAGIEPMSVELPTGGSFEVFVRDYARSAEITTEDDCRTRLRVDEGVSSSGTLYMWRHEGDTQTNYLKLGVVNGARKHIVSYSHYRQRRIVRGYTNGVRHFALSSLSTIGFGLALAGAFDRPDQED